MIYLASAYSHPDPLVREARFQAACKKASEIMRAGAMVFSPVSHGHPIALYGLPTGWDYWGVFNREIMACCNEVRVLMLPGWLESVGVQAEIDLAHELGIPVTYIEA